MVGLMADNRKGGVDDGVSLLVWLWGISATGSVDEEVTPLFDSSHYFCHGVDCTAGRNC
jgi:hypothetical protein